MMRHGLCGGLAFALFTAMLWQAPAQEGKDAPKKEAAPSATKGDDDYRQFFRKPQTAAEYFRAIQFELEVGRFDLAAGHLHGLIASKPSDEALVELADKDGMASILRLRNAKPPLPTPPDTKATEAEIARLQASRDNIDRVNVLRDEVRRMQRDYDEAVAREKQFDTEVETLITSVTQAIAKVRGDSKRILSLIQELSASPEEKAYALRELYKSGGIVVPYLIDGLKTAQVDERPDIVDALRRLGSDTLSPILAALDSDDAQLKNELLDVLRQRNSKDAVPALWILSAGPTQTPEIRRKATELLSRLLDTPANRLPAAKVALTREAERYYNHQVAFANAANVTVWRWVDGHLVMGWPGAATVPATLAEEYYGTRYARQALSIDPAFVPAQTVLLSLALDKGSERSGLAQPLSQGAPAVNELVSSASPDAIRAVLERALEARRTPVALQAVRILGGMADPRASRPSAKGEPLLVRALWYPERRVQFAAAEALLQGAAPPASAAAPRILDILKRAVVVAPAAAPAQPTVLIGHFNADTLGDIGEAVRKAGYNPILVRTGREVMQRLGQAADIDLLMLDANLPDPGLASLLGQLQSDTYASQLPIILLAAPGREDALSRFTASLPNLTLAPAELATTPAQLPALIKSRLGDANSAAPLSEAERKEYAERAARYLKALATGEIPGFDIRPAASAILDTLRANSLSAEGQLALIHAAGQISGARTQSELTAVIVDARRQLAVRVAAAEELIRHLQRHSVLMGKAELASLESVLADQRTEPALKGQLALLLGSTRRDAKLTGERLLKYQPQPPAPAPKKEAEPDKEK